MGIATWSSLLRMLIWPKPYHCPPPVSTGPCVPVHSTVKIITQCLHWEGNCSPGNNRLYRMGVSQAQNSQGARGRAHRNIGASYSVCLQPSVQNRSSRFIATADNRAENFSFLNGNYSVGHAGFNP